MESLKILLTNSFYPPYHLGGDATHVQHLATLLANEGHEVHVVFSIDAFFAKQFGARNIKTRPFQKGDGVKIHPLRSPLSIFEPVRTYTLGYSNWITKKIETIIKSIKPNVIHHHNYSLLGNGVFKLNRLVDISLLTLHDYYPICQQNSLFKFGKKICENPECLRCSFLIRRPYQIWRHLPLKYSILNNDFIISPSQFLKNIILTRSRFSNILSGKMRVIPNFLNPINLEIEEDYKRKFGQYFVYSGKITYIKGIEKLLRSFALFSKEFHNVNLVLIGNGDMIKKAKSFASNLKINGEIIFLGKTDYFKNLQIIKNSRGLILPSIWMENCPMTLIESIFLETIPIATRLGGMIEIISRLNSNLLINPEKFEKDLSRIMGKVYSGDFKISPRTFKKTFLRFYSTSAYLSKYNILLDGKSRR